ncbi:hypothetical protein [Mangrovicoccus sp. HB161399]|uniref:hypothetical protein n=1 Tax=Mangrovicoccus sp. HB161399 TaxID=2720392 RepID=UPI0015533AC0|nr:hypothetical protein [Mangrovicoccus sp. HB161399]
MHRLTLHLAGPVRLVDGQGAELPVKSVKARALLAVLAMSHGARCQRARLMELLWSRGRAQESLRQELRKLRMTAGADIFLGGTGWVGLDRSVVAVESASPQDGFGPAEFCDDLDTIREPEFEDWLRDCRQAMAPPGPAFRPPEPEAPPEGRAPSRPAVPVRITIGACDCAEDGQRIHAEMLLRDAAHRAAPLMHGEICESGPAAPAEGLLLGCRAAGGYGRIILQPQVVRAEDGKVVWSQFFAAPDELLAEMLADAVAATTVALVSAASKLRGAEGTGGPGRTEAAIPFADVFSFDRDRLARADAQLAVLQEGGGSGGILALRAMVRHNQLMERFVADPHECLDEADRLAHHALEQSPQDPFALSVASLTAGLVHGDEMALELAVMAKRADPDHAFVRQSLSVALSFTGHAEEAHAEANAARSNRMALLAPPLFHIRNAKSALGVGDRRAALRWGILAVQGAPSFRAAHRFVAALAYDAGEEETALRSLQALRALEPDFSLDLMAGDSYPVFTLRAAGLMAVTRSGLI